MAEFFRTYMGRAFYEGTMPRIAKALETIANGIDERDKGKQPIARHKINADLRKKIVEALAEDYANSLTSMTNSDYLLDIGRNGLVGFESLSDDDLIRSFFDAGLEDIFPDVAADIDGTRRASIRKAADAIGVDLSTGEEVTLKSEAIIQALEIAYDSGVDSVMNANEKD